MSLLTRLKQRKLVQWALAYLAGAFVVVQLMDALSEPLGLGLLGQRAVLVLLAVGLAATVTAAWYHGEKGRQRVTGAELLIVALLLVIAGSVLGLLIQPAGSWADGAVVESARPEAVSEADRPSIAVLPLADLSPAGDQAYFADGIAEEILTALARIEGLHVASRTSAFRYRDPDRSISEIGRELGVATVLEGSVRTDEGNRIRVTAQLIDVATDRHLWAEDYDREMESIFAVQEEIARAVSRALRVELLGGSDEPVFATTTPEVYRLYLLARHHMARRTATDVGRAIELFDSAAAVDPTYPPAWGGLASAYFLGSQYIATDPPRVWYRRAMEAGERALALDPSWGEALSVMGLTQKYGDYEWEAAERALRRAAELRPGDASIHHYHGGVLLARGRFDEAREAWNRALELDPVSPIIMVNATFPDLYEGRLEQAMEGYQRVLDLGPGFDWTPMWIGAVHLQRGDYEAAVKEMERAGLDNTHVLGYLGYAYGRARREKQARALIPLVDGSTPGPSNSHSVAMIHLGLGEREQAVRWLERAYAERNPHIVEAAVRPEFRELRGHPGFEALLERMGLDDVPSVEPR